MCEFIIVVGFIFKFILFGGFFIFLKLLARREVKLNGISIYSKAIDYSSSIPLIIVIIISNHFIKKNLPTYSEYYWLVALIPLTSIPLVYHFIFHKKFKANELNT